MTASKITSRLIRRAATRGGGTVKEYFKFGFGAGLGAGLSHIIFLLIGMAFLIPGIFMLGGERKKPKEERSQSRIIGAYILMAIGVVLGLGMGAGFLFSNILQDVVGE